jgi:hypothetical protein
LQFPYKIFEIFTEKNNHVEGLSHQYFEGLVKDIQIVVSVVSENRRINVLQHLKIFYNFLGIEIWDLNQARLTCLIVFFGTFLVKNDVDAKREHKMKKNLNARL